MYWYVDESLGCQRSHCNITIDGTTIVQTLQLTGLCDTMCPHEINIASKKECYLSLRGLFRFTDSVLLLRSRHLFAGDPLHSLSSPRCRWCMLLSKMLPLLEPPVLRPNALLLQQLPLAATATWNPLWPLLTWKGPDVPFLSASDLAFSMTAASE